MKNLIDSLSVNSFRQRVQSLKDLLPTFLVIVLVNEVTALQTATEMTSTRSVLENVSLSTVEIIRYNGYVTETHSVVTEDGYVLELHRIPKSKNGQTPTKNFPVFFHHAFLSSSAEWVLTGANTSLSMQLADAGYDVWFANSRGNTYSRNHKYLNTKQNAFWNFSFHEIGKYDLPASIDYILTETNTSQLHYIGYSMGTTVFFVMASERPEYQPKIRSQISLAPVAFLSNSRSPIRYLAPYAKVLNTVYQRLNNGMFFPQSKIRTAFTSFMCGSKFTQKFLCEKIIMFSVSGSDPYLFDSKLVPLMMGHYPMGTSAKVVEHFAQFLLKDRFGQYDYGATVNWERYNSTEPPDYDLKSIQVPITLIYGQNDLIADVKDVMRLKSQLPKLVDTILVNNTYCNHLDFLASIKVNEHVNDPVKNILQRTDSLDWVYSAAPSRPDKGKNDYEDVTAAVGLRSPAGSSDNGQKFESNNIMEYFKRNLNGTTLADTMHRPTTIQQTILQNGILKEFLIESADFKQLEDGSNSVFFNRSEQG